MKEPPRNLAASVRQRLLNLARARREEFQWVLTRYALERLLYRLSLSPQRDEFVLKGAMLFTLWGGEGHRPTRDLDLLGHGEPSVERMEVAFRDLCQVQVEDDGLEFDPHTLRVTRLREEALYSAVRVEMECRLGVARIQIQVDIGFGDAVVPKPRLAEVPTLLGSPSPKVRTYSREAVVAEKLHALVTLGMANSRMKDFYDLWFLARRFAFEGQILLKALTSTFRRRRAPLPADDPLALTAVFGEDPAKVAQWTAFLRKSGIPTGTVPRLVEVVSELRAFLLPLILAMKHGGPFAGTWQPGGPWSAPTASTGREA